MSFDDLLNESSLDDVGDRNKAKIEIALLEEFLNEYCDYIPSHNDISFIDNMINTRSDFLKGKLPDREINRYNEVHSTKILRLIKSHSEYYKDHGNIAYCIEEKMVPESELKEILIQISKERSKIRDQDRNFLANALRILNEDRNLSAAHVRTLEGVITRFNDVNNKLNSGYIYLLGGRQSTLTFPGINYIKGIVNFGLEGKKKMATPRNEEIVKFWDLYFGPDKRKSYDNLIKEYGGSGKKYENAVTVLEEFMKKVDPKIHEFKGLTLAIPKKH